MKLSLRFQLRLNERERYDIPCFTDCVSRWIIFYCLLYDQEARFYRASTIEFGTLASGPRNRSLTSPFYEFKQSWKTKKKRKERKKDGVDEPKEKKNLSLFSHPFAQLLGSGVLTRGCNRVVISSWASLPSSRHLRHSRAERERTWTGPSWPEFFDSSFCQQMA